MQSYKTLEQIFSKIHLLDQTIASIGWDMSTMAPKNGLKAKSEQIATLEKIKHAIITDEEVKELIDSSKEVKKLDKFQKRNLSLIENNYIHATAINSKLVEEFSLAGSECESVWREARKNNDFKSLAPKLARVVELVKEIAKAKSDKLQVSEYDALLDQYDPGRKSEEIDKIFDNLSEFLPNFIQEVQKKQAKKKTIQPESFAIEKQKELAKELLSQIGFNFDSGRLDESLHPFCGGYKGDVRITTRYNEENFINGLMGIFHEAGHANYEQNLPEKFINQPIGQSLGMTIHESQSLLYEMQICRSKEFLEFLTPKIKNHFAIKSRNFTANNLYNTINNVQPSLIRVDADEVTYPAHIILRYKIEKMLLAGDMDVKDLPEAWAQGMDKFLNIKPKDDKDGCMQDIHWMDGSFGYFPTYTLGAIAAASFFKTAKEQDENIMKNIKNGDFSPINSWLAKNIHNNGSLYKSDNLIKNVTGNYLDVENFKSYLSEKYLGEKQKVTQKKPLKKKEPETKKENTEEKEKKTRKRLKTV